MSPGTASADATEEADRAREGLYEVHRGHKERPDPEEPWRYACTSCGAPHIEIRRSGQRYKCIRCGERSDLVHDRRNDKVVRP